MAVSGCLIRIVLTEGAASSFTAVMAVCTAAPEVPRHRHAQRPRAGTSCTMSAPRGVNLSSILAIVRFQVGGPVRGHRAAWAEYRGTLWIYSGEGHDGAGWAEGQLWHVQGHSGCC